MEIVVLRKYFTSRSSIGEVSIDGHFSYFSIERETLENCEDPHDITVAIPEGRYPVIIDHSDHFGRLMPHILDVPDYDGIRFHIANEPKDLEGCIGLGLLRGDDFIGNSELAFNDFFNRLQIALKTDKAYVTICHQEIEVV